MKDDFQLVILSATPEEDQEQKVKNGIPNLQDFDIITVTD